MATITKRQYTSWQVSTADSRGTKIKKTFLCRTIAESFLEQLQQDGVSAKLSKATSLAWQARVRKKGFPPLTETFQTKAEAEAWSVAREAEMMQRRFVDYRAAERNTLGDLLRRYAEKVLATKPKSDPEHSRIRKLCRHPISNIAMHMLQKSDIAMYRDMRLEGGFVEPDDGRKLSVSARTWVKVKGSTVVKEMELISRIISLAIKEWDIHLPFNPASGNHCSRPAKHPTDERNRRLDDRQLGILEKSKDISVAHIEIKDFDMDETLIELVKKSPGELINLMRACRYPHWFRKNSSFKNCNKKIRRSIKSRDRKRLRLWAIVSFAIETAMRRSEILRLRWKDIKLKNQVVICYCLLLSQKPENNALFHCL